MAHSKINRVDLGGLKQPSQEVLNASPSSLKWQCNCNPCDDELIED